jgi:adenylyltransferase/sulfurtransferase
MVRQITVHELARRLKSKEPTFLLDVRHPWEHEIAALPGSVLIPLAELPSSGPALQPPAEALIVVYCHHGIRSLSGAALLEQQGFTNVASLAGGIDAWSLLVDPAVPRY